MDLNNLKKMKNTIKANKNALKNTPKTPIAPKPKAAPKPKKFNVAPKTHANTLIGILHILGLINLDNDGFAKGSLFTYYFAGKITNKVRQLSDYMMSDKVLASNVSNTKGYRYDDIIKSELHSILTGYKNPKAKVNMDLIDIKDQIAKYQKIVSELKNMPKYNNDLFIFDEKNGNKWIETTQKTVDITPTDFFTKSGKLRKGKERKTATRSYGKEDLYYAAFIQFSQENWENFSYVAIDRLNYSYFKNNVYIDVEQMLFEIEHGGVAKPDNFEAETKEIRPILELRNYIRHYKHEYKSCALITRAIIMQFTRVFVGAGLIKPTQEMLERLSDIDTQFDENFN